MELITKAPKGTQDILPKDMELWDFIESSITDEARINGFKEIRTPVFEHTELFQRSVGETTDVVQKEMYTFNDKGGRSVTLRPEGTAGAVRAMLENALYNEGYPVKLNYFTTCYRYENTQKGRLREFHQFGAEVFGAGAPSADAELISMANAIFDRIGLRDIELQINSIGCPHCRAKYHEALKAYLSTRSDCLCATCRERLDRNPMRVLDCKVETCSEIASEAPVILDYLCVDCRDHFDKVKKYLDIAGIEYTVNPHIVRGLDYYTRTVFEFISTDIGAQSTICGGGRYDGLVEEMGGASTPALGFAIGLERLVMVFQEQGNDVGTDDGCEIYIAAMNEATLEKAFELSILLRESGIHAQIDICSRGLKAQMKYANRIGAKYVVVLGDDEIANAEAKLKNMATGEQTPISLDDDFVDSFMDKSMSDMELEMEEAEEEFYDEDYNLDLVNGEEEGFSSEEDEEDENNIDEDDDEEADDGDGKTPPSGKGGDATHFYGNGYEIIF